MVVVVLVVAVVPLGAAAAPASPATAPADASVPVMIATFMALEDFIGNGTSWVGLVGMPTMFGARPKKVARSG